MNIWNKVFLGLIFVLAITILFFTSLELKIRGEGQKAVNTLGEKGENLKNDIENIKKGNAPAKAVEEKKLDELGFDELQVQLSEMIYERKKAKFDCKPVSINVEGEKLPPNNDNPPIPDDKLKPVSLIEVKLAIEKKDSDVTVSLTEELKGIVYVFEASILDSGTQGNNFRMNGAFLGMFNVIETQPQSNGSLAALLSAHELTEQEIQQVQESLQNANAGKTAWAVYTTMPLDRYEGLFDRLTDDEKKSLPKPLSNKLLEAEQKLKDFNEQFKQLPDAEKNALSQSLQEKLKKAGGKLETFSELLNWFSEKEKQELPELLQEILTTAEWKLKDFNELLNWFYQHRVELTDRIVRAANRVEDMKKDLKIADNEEKKLQKDIELEKKRIDRMQLQCQVLHEKINDYDKMITALRNEIEKTQTENEWYVARIAEYQLKAKELLEQQAEQATREIK
jgi:hypothetical protein